MSLIDNLQGRLQRHPKRIVFPEGNDPRILQAARQFATRRLGVPILLGERGDIKDRASRLDIRLDGMRIVEPERSDDFEVFLAQMSQMPRFSRLSNEQRRQLLLDKNYYATFMLSTFQADALVGGATVSASSALRPLFQIIPTQEHVKTASSLLIVDQDDSKLGINGVLFMADCGVIPEPNAEQLADIAVTTADIGYHLTGVMPRVAMLSFATHSSSNTVHPSILRIREATVLARIKAKAKKLTFEIDGEIQVDAALDAVVARQKDVCDSAVAGQANVLIFPDLNCGNIASKLVQQIAGTRSYGQIITGLRRPCAEISRGAHAIDIFGTAIIVGCQALDRHLLGEPYGSDEPSNVPK
ncbi:MAG: phosphate acyltransferase [Verrucomicrobiota bacterium]|nr:phosphate acyltransferase [Verrucomicrobiota bacterium]